MERNWNEKASRSETSGSSACSRGDCRKKSEAEVEAIEKCFCGLPAKLYTAWKDTKNAGRRFYGCSKYRDDPHAGEKVWCDSLVWIDPILCQRSRDVIRELRFRQMRTEADNGRLRRQTEHGGCECSSLQDLKIILKEVEELKLVLVKLEKSSSRMWSVSALFVGMVCLVLVVYVVSLCGGNGVLMLGM